MNTTFKLPVIVAAADWSVDVRNRSIAIARLASDGFYAVDDLPTSVSSPSTLISDLQHQSANTGTILLGLDLPIGLPREYARRAGLSTFRHALELFDKSAEWRHFYVPSDEPNLHQPFGPATSKAGFNRSKLAKLIGLESEAALLRRCERKTASRNQAESLFFLRFAKQVGRSAIQGWREVIGPSRESIHIWPFDGTIAELLLRGGVTVAEIYPAEAAAQLSLSLGPGTARSKRRQGDRAAVCEAFLKVSAQAGIVFGAEVEKSVTNGCNSEHDFDALVAVVAMIRTLRGIAPSEPPDDPLVHSIEGWILGRERAEYSPPQADRAHIKKDGEKIKTPYAIKQIQYQRSADTGVIDLAYPTQPGVGALNVICGLNNSGKSSLLEQIYRVSKGKKHRGGLEVIPKPSGQPRILFLGKTWTDKDRIGIVNLDQREATLTLGGEHGDYLRCGLSFMLAQMGPYLSGVEEGEVSQLVLDPAVRKQIQKLFEVDKQVYRCRAEDPLVRRLERLLEGRLYFRCFRQKPTGRAWQFEFVLVYEDGTTVPYKMWSDGQRACFYVLLCLAYFRPDVVLFDELENHLHPAFISEVLGMLRGFPVQSIVATHHPHLIFSRLADRVFYIETKRPRPHAYPPKQLPFSAKYTDFERGFQELRDDFERVTAAYRLFNDQDDQLLRQANYLRTRATLLLVKALSRLFVYPPVAESPGVSPDTQTQQLSSRLKAFTRLSGKDPVEILDLGSGVGRQIAELRKFSTWQLGTRARWTCYEPIEANRQILEDRFRNDASVTIVHEVSALGDKRFDLCVIANVLHELTPPEFADYLSLATDHADQESGGTIILELFPLLHAEGYAVPYDDAMLQKLLDTVGFSVDVAQISLRQSGTVAYCLLARKRLSADRNDISRAVEHTWEEILAITLSAYALRATPTDLAGYQSLLSQLATIASITSWKTGKWLPRWSSNPTPNA